VPASAIDRGAPAGRGFATRDAITLIPTPASMTSATVQRVERRVASFRISARVARRKVTRVGRTAACSRRAERVAVLMEPTLRGVCRPPSRAAVPRGWVPGAARGKSVAPGGSMHRRGGSTVGKKVHDAMPASVDD
jgi:hypothetical protein